MLLKCISNDKLIDLIQEDNMALLSHNHATLE